VPTLAEQLSQAKPDKTHRSRPCLTCEWLKTLSPDDRQALDDAILSGAWFVVDLYRLCQANGLTVSKDGFRRHVQNH
jgi:hypothetical protein